MDSEADGQDAHLAGLRRCQQRHADREPASRWSTSTATARWRSASRRSRSRTRSFTSYGSREVSTIYAPANQYSVILEVEPEYQRDPESLSKL